ncbi:hypothetical protein PLICRDRAFT_49690 [Plicaturopsis crispa FD-325 SS-3]|nr:hypothetical protein PLICRDRAFT_49690 [Plicaturopsis crispa FD-325 SS-3]
MSKKERDEMLSALASRVFNTMLDDVVLDVTLQSHHEAARNRAICHVCNTRHTVHAAGPSNSAAPTVSTASPSAANGTGASTPSSKSDGNIYFDCLNCKRPIASNRYAPHLSGCMGLGTGSRRGAARGANAKSKTASEAARSASPYFGSDNGNMSDDGAKGKGKSKMKRADDAEFNLNKRKRPASPQVSPNKKPKKGKATGSPQAVSRVKAQPDGGLSTTHLLPHSGSQSRVPSKLRASSTASFVADQSSSPESSSSLDTPVASTSTPTSTSASGKSPSIATTATATTAGRGRKKGVPSANRKINGLPPRLPSPPRPPPPPVRIAEPDYLIDVEGEETGSSTDTDDS